MFKYFYLKHFILHLKFRLNQVILFFFEHVKAKYQNRLIKTKEDFSHFYLYLLTNFNFLANLYLHFKSFTSNLMTLMLVELFITFAIYLLVMVVIQFFV
jgi:hypothetical protein